MPKVKAKSLTPLEEKTLLAMFTVELIVGQGGMMSGKAISNLLGGRWSQHRHNTMITLSELGWVTIHTLPYDASRKHFYRLTDAARHELKRRYSVPTADFVPDQTEQTEQQSLWSE